MTLKEALTKLAHDAMRDGLPPPVIKMPPHTLVRLSLLIEEELGGLLYGTSRDRHEGFYFCGMKFEP